MKTADALQAKLAQSLDRANKTIPKQTKSISKPRPKPKTQTQNSVPVAQSKTAQKISISLYAFDIEQIQATSLHLLQNGSQISVSEAVRLALRTIKIDDKLLRVYEDIKLEDGRRK